LDFSPLVAVVMTMIAVANAAKTKLNAVANVAATKLTMLKKAKLPSKLPLLQRFYLHSPCRTSGMGFFVPSQIVSRLEIWRKNLSRHLSLKTLTKEQL